MHVMNQDECVQAEGKGPDNDSRWAQPNTVDPEQSICFHGTDQELGGKNTLKSSDQDQCGQAEGKGPDNDSRWATPTDRICVSWRIAGEIPRFLSQSGQCVVQKKVQMLVIKQDWCVQAEGKGPDGDSRWATPADGDGMEMQQVLPSLSSLQPEA